jgi:hypothetical protein
MKEYQQRVKSEKEELDIKLNRLDAFLAGNLFNTLPEDEQFRMKVQRHHMQGYSDSLAERLQFFK